MGEPYMGEHGNIVYRGAGGGATGGGGFNAESYLAHNPDVGAAIAGGTVNSPQEHWEMFGQYEGRKGAFPDAEAPAEGAAPPPTDDPLAARHLRTNEPGMPQSILDGRYAAQAINSMPHVLDPLRLSLDPNVNRAMMQAGPVSRAAPPMPLPRAGKSGGGGLLGGLFG